MINWKPPKSPHGLIQESLWPNEWKILVSCLLLNQTTRRQVDKVIDRLFRAYPEPNSMSKANDKELKSIITSLGMSNKRTKTLKRFSQEYLSKDWDMPIDLYGCGKYANDTWLIFCKGEWKSTNPNDHALNNYHDYLNSLEGES